MNYLVAEKEKLTSQSHRFCNLAIIFADNEKDATKIYNQDKYVDESVVLATIDTHVDEFGLFSTITPISEFWHKESKTIKNLFDLFLKQNHVNVRYILQ
jgi:hypothetical protein